MENACSAYIYSIDTFGNLLIKFNETMTIPDPDLNLTNYEIWLNEIKNVS